MTAGARQRTKDVGAPGEVARGKQKRSKYGAKEGGGRGEVDGSPAERKNVRKCLSLRLDVPGAHRRNPLAAIS